MATLILNLIYLVVAALLSPITLLPNVVLNSGFGASITTGMGYLMSFDFIFPVGTLISLLGISVSIEVAYFAYKIIMWIIKKIPTVN
jgi:hypothetical protein